MIVTTGRRLPATILSFATPAVHPVAQDEGRLVSAGSRVDEQGLASVESTMLSPFKSQA